MAQFTIREWNSDDVPALARLHVRTFNETHVGPFGRGPKVELRESQWRRKFDERALFCFVAANATGELVGFASGAPGDDAVYAGHLDKIYVLRSCHRQGIGRLLFCRVVNRFLRDGIRSMNLFSQARNRSLGFFDAMGGERLLADNGDFHGGYGWRDLGALAAQCPAE